ncbi:MAG: FAD-dependent monooxygenase [Verrucomicrobia bacterium]|nr:FAD-dependent monooxygenase [Verrucomicrobiota bacterium]
MINPPPQPIEIVGGGLAGLSLGLALCRAGVPVRVLEAHGYPRHRVCGEFITGLDVRTIDRLGLAPFLADARPHREVAWFHRHRLLRRQTLPDPALALSRHALDERLAHAFVCAGGELRTHARADLAEAPAGRVFATGRRPVPSDWIGLKCHVHGLTLSAGLELHLGDHAYVGLCAVEGDRVNISGLFRQHSGLAVSRATALPSYLRSCGLDALADRLASADIDAGSWSAVAGLGFDRPAAPADRLVIGDTFAMIPPFTGNGMAMAFQSAADALGPLLAWSRGEADWTATIRVTRHRLRRRFRVRLASAAMLHPFLFHPQGQRCLAAASHTRILPINTLYGALH